MRSIRKSNVYRWLALPVLALSLCLVSFRPARADTALDLEMAVVAKGIKKFLDGEGKDAIALKQFTGPDNLPTSAGPFLAKTLADQLRKLNVKVKAGAAFIVEGRYRDVIDKKSQLLAAAITIKVLDRQNEVQFTAGRNVLGNVTVPALFGLTVSLPADADLETRDQRVRDAIDKPAANLNGTRIAAPGSPYAIEILVKTDKGYSPRKPAVKNGLPYVAIERGEVYAVRLINRARHEAAVTLTIDGLNFYSFSDVKGLDGRPRYSMVILPANSVTIIKGWHRTNDHSDEFRVTEYAKSAAAELKSSANLGTITANFAAAWKKDGSPPPDEPKQPPPHSRSADATGRGQRVEARYIEVERVFGVVRASISVRYTK